MRSSQVLPLAWSFVSFLPGVELREEKNEEGFLLRFDKPFLCSFPPRKVRSLPSNARTQCLYGMTNPCEGSRASIRHQLQPVQLHRNRHCVSGRVRHDIPSHAHGDVHCLTGEVEPQFSQYVRAFVARVTGYTLELGVGTTPIHCSTLEKKIVAPPQKLKHEGEVVASLIA